MPSIPADNDNKNSQSDLFRSYLPNYSGYFAKFTGDQVILFVKVIWSIIITSAIMMSWWYVLNWFIFEEKTLYSKYYLYLVYESMRSVCWYLLIGFWFIETTNDSNIYFLPLLTTVNCDTENYHIPTKSQVASFRSENNNSFSALQHKPSNTKIVVSNGYPIRKVIYTITAAMFIVQLCALDYTSFEYHANNDSNHFHSTAYLRILCKYFYCHQWHLYHLYRFVFGLPLNAFLVLILNHLCYIFYYKYLYQTEQNDTRILNNKQEKIEDNYHINNGNEYLNVCNEYLMYNIMYFVLLFVTLLAVYATLCVHPKYIGPNYIVLYFILLSETSLLKFLMKRIARWIDSIRILHIIPRFTKKKEKISQKNQQQEQNYRYVKQFDMPLDHTFLSF